MTEIRTGIRRVLDQPRLYDLLQSALGVPTQRQSLVDAFIRPRPGMRILDVGCGTAGILDHLAEHAVSYHGLDPSQDYVDFARGRWAKRSEFTFDVIRGSLPAVDAKYDLVLLMGVIHHMADHEVTRTLEFARQRLSSNGRLVSIDPGRLDRMNLLERGLARFDRGQHVRTVEQYAALIEEVFPSWQVTVARMTHVPARAVVFECGRQPGSPGPLEAE